MKKHWGLQRVMALLLCFFILGGMLPMMAAAVPGPDEQNAVTFIERAWDSAAVTENSRTENACPVPTDGSMTDRRLVLSGQQHHRERPHLPLG